ncbi:protein FAR1-RELATED SEQUENCE 3-like [Bidens hawaiensis]|uniref:protein FAR1-RELATED SEQUENCE 3-like n=1 Tax=Bidens hawaiensis TaxID=980011 RepID=UPI0040496789
MILFVGIDGVVYSMVNADEIEEGEFVDHSLTKEHISLLLDLNEEEDEELGKKVDVDVKIEESTNTGIPHGNVPEFDEVEDVHALMDLEVHSGKEDLETNLIENIDANGYLVINSSSDVEVEKTEDAYLKKERTNEVIGQVFDTPDHAYTFYNRYAFLHGFGICILSTFKNRTTNVAYRMNYVCNKEVFKDIKRVDEFNDAHNHELTVTPTKVMKHRSHGKFQRSMACKSLMLELGQSGLRRCQIKKVVNTIKNPGENDVTSKQCANVLNEQRKQYKGKEFYGLIKHFQDKLLEDPNLYFVVDLCDDGSPRNIFWADGRSKDSYIKFSDVIVFDVTYMTNKFKMPFAPFFGVNHHHQSILFASALLENEKQDTFEWLFQTFLKCMFDKHPLAIITDQDKAIGNAIKTVFPKSPTSFLLMAYKET